VTGALSDKSLGAALGLRVGPVRIIRYWPVPLSPCQTLRYKRMFVSMGGANWRERHRFAWQSPDPAPDEGPGLTWRQLTPRHWSGTWDSKIRGTVTRDGDGWVAYLRLEDPPGLSPITTVGRCDSIEGAQLATDEVWASR
jgi:hypothetical protein